MFPMDAYNDDGASLFRINGVATTSNWVGVHPPRILLKLTNCPLGTNKIWLIVRFTACQIEQINLATKRVNCLETRTSTLPQCYKNKISHFFKKNLFVCIVPPRQRNYTDGIFLADVSLLRHDERLNLSAKISKIKIIYITRSYDYCFKLSFRELNL